MINVQGKGERGRGGAWENGEIWGGAGQILNFIMASNDYWEAKPIRSSWTNQFHFILTPSFLTMSCHQLLAQFLRIERMIQVL